MSSFRIGTTFIFGAHIITEEHATMQALLSVDERMLEFIGDGLIFVQEEYYLAVWSLLREDVAHRCGIVQRNHLQYEAFLKWLDDISDLRKLVDSRLRYTTQMVHAITGKLTEKSKSMIVAEIRNGIDLIGDPSDTLKSLQKLVHRI